MPKYCWRCKTQKSADDFFKNKRSKDGLQTCCKNCSKENNRNWRLGNIEKCRAYVNKCSAKNRDQRRDAAKAKYHQDIDKSREAARSRASRRKPKLAAYARNFRKRPDRAIHHRIGAQIRYALGSGKGGKSAFDLVGYSVEELMCHLERQFVRGMSWENMGEWHIDHIIPINSFRISGPDDPAISLAWALTNLRPLWARENISKGDKRTLLV